MDVQAITREIMHGNMSNADLESVILAVKFARARLTNETKRSLSIGNTVTFKSSRLGSHTGRVEKIAVKYVTIRTPQGLYKVPANMVEVV